MGISFAVCGPAAWNSLPAAVRDFSSSSSGTGSYSDRRYSDRQYSDRHYSDSSYSDTPLSMREFYA